MFLKARAYVRSQVIALVQLVMERNCSLQMSASRTVPLVLYALLLDFQMFRRAEKYNNGPFVLLGDQRGGSWAKVQSSSGASLPYPPSSDRPNPDNGKRK